MDAMDRLRRGGDEDKSSERLREKMCQLNKQPNGSEGNSVRLSVEQYISIGMRCRCDCEAHSSLLHLAGQKVLTMQCHPYSSRKRRT